MKPKLSGSKEWLFWYEAQERKYEKESERLQALNAELLAACKAVVHEQFENDSAYFRVWKLCESAIAKATESEGE